jgi:hypothetical protein
MKHTCRHSVQFYGDDHGLLAASVCGYLAEGLRRGERAVVIAVPAHTEAFVGRLERMGAKPGPAIAEGRLLLMDAQRTLASLMVNGQPDQPAFHSHLGALVRELTGNREAAGLRAYGEMVGLLWESGDPAAAVLLERYWNELLADADFGLHCAYPIDVFAPEFRPGAIDGVLEAHTHLIPAAANGDLEIAVGRAMYETFGQGVQTIRQGIQSGPGSAAALAPAEAAILWLKRNRPDEAEEVLTRAWQHYQVLTRLPRRVQTAALPPPLIN